MSRFIPDFHYDHPTSKMTDEWRKKAVNYCYFQSGNKSLLHKKNVKEIEEYATGKIDMRPFKRMYKSIKEQDLVAEDSEKFYANQMNKKQMQFEPLPMIPSKLNAAIETIQKVPFEIWVKAMDALAVRKRDEDLEILRTKKAREEDLQPLADELQIGDVSLSTTKHSAIKYSSSPYGIDLNEPDETQVFIDLLYNLAVETSFETVLQIFYETKKLDQYRYLQTMDQYKWGVSVHCSYQSAMTGMPDYRYIYPGNLFVPNSDLPDYSDRSHEFEHMEPSVIELYNYFSDEIGSKDVLKDIMNGNYGYFKENGLETPIERNFDNSRVTLVYCKIKSVDWIGYKKLSDSDDYTLTHEDGEGVEKIWAQNTYTFYWLKNTKYFFNASKLGYAHRKVGEESYQGFDTNIYKSCEKSAVELCVGENKKAQTADIKMQHAIIKSLPAGRVIDLKGLRGALDGLKEVADFNTIDRLLQLALEENIFIIDTEDFDGKNDGQLKPFYEVPGGLKSEIIGYQNAINDANAKMDQFTGINAQLSGQGANQEGLVGMQKLLINGSINSINYVYRAITSQFQGCFNIWAYIIKDGMKNPKVKRSIETMIGIHKADIIDGLKDASLHSMGVKIGFTQREEEREIFRSRKEKLIEQGAITVADEYMIDAADNPKDKRALLAIKEKQFIKRRQQQIDDERAHQLEMAKATGQNMLMNTQAETQGAIQEIGAKTEGEAKIRQLASKLKLQEIQIQGLISRALQRDRGIDQNNKEITKARERSAAEAQESLV